MSKLQLYERILEALVNKPLTLDRIAYEINLNCVFLDQRLDFLIKNKLIEKRGSSEEVLYAVTEKGIAVLRALNFETYLGKIANNIRVIDEALDMMRRLEKNDMEKGN